MSKTKAMLKHLRHLLKKASGKHRKATRAELRALLKELKHRQRELERRREQEQDKHRRKQLKREIAVIREQRRKGLRAYRDASS